MHPVLGAALDAAATHGVSAVAARNAVRHSTHRFVAAGLLRDRPEVRTHTGNDTITTLTSELEDITRGHVEVPGQRLPQPRSSPRERNNRNRTVASGIERHVAVSTADRSPRRLAVA